MSPLILDIMLATLWMGLTYIHAMGEAEPQSEDPSTDPETNAVKGNIFLDDGILIRDLGNIQRVGALHSLIVSIEKPVPPNFAGWYNYFINYLGSSKAEIMSRPVRNKISDRLQRLIRSNRIHQVSGHVDGLGVQHQHMCC